MPLRIGWNSLNYSIEELKDPVRNLPRAAVIGLGISAVLYTLANVAYFLVLPAAAIIASEHTVGAEFFVQLKLPGILAVRILPLAMGLSALGAVCCLAFSAIRVIMESARGGYIPILGEQLGSISPRFGTPMAATFLHCLLTTICIVSAPPGGAYAFLIETSSFPSWLFYLLTVIGVIRMRWTHANIHRPVRVPWLIIGLFCTAALFVISWTLVPPVNVTDRVRHGGIAYWIPAVIGIVVLMSTGLLWYVQIILRHGVERSAYGDIKRDFDEDTVVEDEADGDALWSARLEKDLPVEP